MRWPGQNLTNARSLIMKMACRVTALVISMAAISLADQKEIDQLIADLNTAYEAKNDMNAPPIMDKLVIAYRAADEKGKTDIAKALAKAFDQRREENAGDKLFVAAGAALSEMGEMGTKALINALKNKNFKK